MYKIFTLNASSSWFSSGSSLGSSSNQIVYQFYHLFSFFSSFMSFSEVRGWGWRGWRGIYTSARAEISHPTSIDRGCILTYKSSIKSCLNSFFFSIFFFVFFFFVCLSGGVLYHNDYCNHQFYPAVNPVSFFSRSRGQGKSILMILDFFFFFLSSPERESIQKCSKNIFSLSFFPRHSYWLTLKTWNKNHRRRKKRGKLYKWTFSTEKKKAQSLNWRLPE